MPFIGQDWRAPGETWIKTSEGWEQMKLRPLRNSSESLEARIRIHTDSESSFENPFFESQPSPPLDELEIEESPNEEWQPHCFVKTSKSKEFVGCASMSEAFLKLNLTGAVADVRRFNYVCKALQILVQERLQALSGSGRKMLLAIVGEVVLHCMGTNKELNTVRMLVSDFMAGLSGGQHYGSPKLLSQHQDAASNLYQLLTNVQFGTPADCCEESLTFLDLPLECLRSILRRLADHESLLTAAKAHEGLQHLVENETAVWRDLCHFHFTQSQIDSVRKNLRKQQEHERDRQRWKAALEASTTGKENEEPTIIKFKEDDEDSNESSSPPLQDITDGPNTQEPPDWRHLYFELKKFYGMKDVYADMIHICCHCKALFWKGLGHPCVADHPAPSVRVTPHQFIDMLCM